MTNFLPQEKSSKRRQDLEKLYILNGALYLSTAHNSKIFEKYADCLDDVFKLISKCENGYNIKEILNYPLSHNGFERLN